MSKNLSDFFEDSFLADLPELDPETANIKFDLYVKVREIKQIVESLQQILLLSEDNRQDWVDQNEDLISQLMDSFMDDSMLAMDGLHLDSEALDLSVQLISTMRDAMGMVQGILAESKTTAS